MITKDIFRKLIVEKLGFQKVAKNIYKKDFPDLDCSLKVDFDREEMFYPEDKGLFVNERQTCNFKANENFVVFECVHRLLDKGYHPEHIELEPKWKVGHGASGGRADLWIRTINSEGKKKSLLIVECKTFGKAYNDAYNDTIRDGAQLFSYLQQERMTQFLALYASDYDGDNLKTSYALINVQDNKELIDTLTNPKTYQKATNNKELFDTWKETYGQDIASRGLFEEDIAAYTIGKDKYSINDLFDVDNDSIQKKYNQFATILRQHNVSGHENAFDKLVNLFLAKVVDETNNPEELSFYWKGAAYDNYFRLQDRLQKLYKEGMEKFLGEDVTYIDNADIESAFRLFKDDPDATKDAILRYFRQLKFFTNNDFAFIDVHNEKLFYQNAAVLKKIVEMLQDIKLKTDEPNQFLGDLFEGFLDQGVKQSEGQFFTPLPIVRFIISSLPLAQIINSHSEPPKVIDYACGAGHFLNEYAQQIRPLLTDSKKDISKYYETITGIEKEYRLSKVAKVSAFMYGQDEIDIIYADALSKIDRVKDGKYDILIANPPYSVKGFLETLSEEERKSFTLTKEVSDITKNNAIETFFIERASQLLAEGGVAAIVLPSSILSNNNVYLNIKCREIILQNFDIIAISEFGSGTFGKTGTNTVTLFLRKKHQSPSDAKHYRNRVESWFKADFKYDNTFRDSHLLDAYCSHINIDKEVYITLLKNKPSAELWNIEAFQDYRKSFSCTAKAKSILKKRITTKYKEKDKAIELERFIVQSIIDIEKEKLYFFLLANSSTTPVVICKSPSDNKASKKFLGYEWSGAKGNEGIKYLGVSISDDDSDIVKNKGISQIATPLFNPNDFSDITKINTIIRGNFENHDIDIPESLNEFVSKLYLKDMINFSKVTFDKTISLSAINKVEIEYKYPKYRLDDICKVVIGGTPSRENSSYFGGENLWVSIAEMNGQIIQDTKEKITNEGVKQSNVKLIKKGTTLLSFKLSIGKTAIAGTDLYTNEAIAGLVPLTRDPESEKYVSDSYLFYLFNSRIIDLENVGNKAFGKSLNSNFLKTELKIPVPKPEIQNQIVSECELIDKKSESNYIKKKKYEKEITDLFIAAQKTGLTSYRLSNIENFEISIGRRVVENELINNGTYPVYSANVFEEFGRINNTILPNFDSPSIIWGIDGDWMVNYIPAKYAFHPTDHCGVLRVKTDSIEPKYLTWVLNEEGKRARFSRSLRASIERISTLTVNLPNIKIQQDIVNKVKILETKINKAQKIIDSYADTKKQILTRYLL